MVIGWWALSFVLGLGTFPLARRLMGWMADEGYAASKVLNLLISGWITWLLCCAGVPFIGIICWAICLLVSLGCWGLDMYLRKMKPAVYIRQTFSGLFSSDLIWIEEILYFGLFVFWLYLIGFRPEAFGTEKLMDYGFMAGLLRGKKIPAADIWYSNGILNYYYGGQYYVTYLIRLCGTPLKYAYNLFRAMLPALAFIMTFAMVLTLSERSCKSGKISKSARETHSTEPSQSAENFFNRKMKQPGRLSYMAGLLGGAAMTFAANGHFILFYKIIPMLQEMLGLEADTYWFSDSTRYIGYKPDVDDKTIHEYPSYSFILGDLHAHVINIMFVLLFLAVLMNWCFRQGPLAGNKQQKAGMKNLFKEVLQPEILMLSLLAGVFKWTNFWDFAIYFGLAGLTILIMNLRQFDKQPWTIAVITGLQAAAALVISQLVTLPFTLSFDSMFQGIAPVLHHSRFYQLVLLWGIPVTAVLLFIVYICRTEIFENEGTQSAQASTKSIQTSTKKLKWLAAWKKLDITTLVLCMIGIYGILMVLVPEVVYVKDIYGADFSRSNTMFKFTYQAFILFAVFMSWSLIRMITETKSGNRIRKYAWILMALLICTIGYLPAGSRLWFGNFLNPKGYLGSDSTAYLEQTLPYDAAAIRWLDEAADRDDRILEADGSSYSKNDVVSAVTGMPTVLGWYAHEQLWRNNNTDELNVRVADVSALYTCGDIQQVQELINKYQISYIFVGTNEWEKYGSIRTDVFDQLGDVVYTADVSGDYPATCIYKINK